MCSTLQGFLPAGRANWSSALPTPPQRLMEMGKVLMESWNHGVVWVGNESSSHSKPLPRAETRMLQAPSKCPVSLAGARAGFNLSPCPKCGSDPASQGCCDSHKAIPETQSHAWGQSKSNSHCATFPGTWRWLQTCGNGRDWNVKGPGLEPLLSRALGILGREAGKGHIALMADA